jgi:hypothetical protein
MLNGKNSKLICYFDLLTVCHCEERGKKSGGQSSFFRLQFLPAFLPPEERIKLHIYTMKLSAGLLNLVRLSL